MARVGLNLQRERVIELIDGLEWFESLTEADLDRLVDGAHTVVWDAGEIVFEEGDRGQKCYVLHSGRVKVLRRFPDGRRLTLARLGPGAVFGELVMFGPERRSATIQAIEPTVALELSGEDILAVLRTDANASLKVAEHLAERLRATNERLLEHALTTVPGRVVATLLAQVEARQAQGAGDQDVVVTGSPADIARLVGASRENVMRVMAFLENEGAITLKRGKTIVHNVTQLASQLR